MNQNPGADLNKIRPTRPNNPRRALRRTENPLVGLGAYRFGFRDRETEPYLVRRNPVNPGALGTSEPRLKRRLASLDVKLGEGWPSKVSNRQAQRVDTVTWWGSNGGNSPSPSVVELARSIACRLS